MSRVEQLDDEAAEFVADVSRVLRERSTRVPPVKLAELTSVAFERTFTGKRRQDKLAKALVRGLLVQEKMAEQEGGSMSADEAARYLGLSKQSVLNMHRAGKLIAWQSEKQGAFRFPVWQFTDGRRLAGLEQVLARLNGSADLDPWAKVGFFLQTQGLLDDRRPLDLLRKGKLEAVLRAAEAYVE